MDLLDLVFPESCALCGLYLCRGVRAGDFPLCIPCRSKLRELTGRLCGRCGIPLLSERLTCIACRNQGEPFPENRSLYLYADIAELLGAYKTGGRRTLAAFFAERLAHALRSLHPGLPVVPVPSSRAALRKRGWDQMDTIGRLLASSYSIAHLPLLLRGGGAEQKRLGREERRTNLEGRIGIRRGVCVPQALVLIDDVFTTGATILECARVLFSVGVKDVRSVTIAREGPAG